MLLFDLLSASAHRSPDKPAAVFPGGVSITFGELDRRARQLASRLLALGVGPGRRVALLAEASPAALVYFWGALYAGAEPVDVPGHAGAALIAEVLDEHRPAAVAFDAAQLRKLTEPGVAARLPAVLIATREPAELAKALGLEVTVLEEVLAAEAPAETRPLVGPDDVALSIYTSGTTGRPKGVMLSHDNLLSNVKAANELMRLGPDDSLLLVVPLYFIHGRMQLLTHASIGGTIYFSAGFQFPQQVLTELADYRVTGFSGVPYHFNTLLDRTRIRATALPALRYVLATGGALGYSGLKRLAGALPEVQIHTAYGSTEASPRIAYLGPAEVLKRRDCAGRPLPGVKVEILASDGLPVPQGAMGEVAASGPNVMKGYISGDHLSSGRIDERGRLRTGDLGYLDADGYLYLAGRSSDMIKTAGERVFPQEIEEVINKHPAVRECAVLGARDPVLGERLVALVVTQAALAPDLTALRTHCLRWLPFVRTPREVHVVAELPKTASAKVNRGALPALLDACRAAATADLEGLKQS